MTNGFWCGPKDASKVACTVLLALFTVLVASIQNGSEAVVKVGLQTLEVFLLALSLSDLMPKLLDNY